MGGHGHGPPYVVTKASDYSIKGIWELEELEKALARKGLKDPWIRNEAWRYSPAFGTKWMRARKLFFRGFPLGLGLAIATVALGKLSGDDHHGHGHEGH
ncbi:NADH dehydrogenase [ubiquinone] 1 beta subcomplex subunit 3 [Aricia agestis]|uniref:NADH dehydrogenase [ubiquinone] 1 beta subcomplex subunit 3 n=1 Tax=Aricia agestis TaxID=91739 RepID=UPI001C203D7F|nr:NADH dehydrogenase [ubiquinone] 1 beta subcomplex subunit 3 [Aricia agestis]